MNKKIYMGIGLLVGGYVVIFTLFPVFPPVVSIGGIMLLAGMIFLIHGIRQAKNSAASSAPNEVVTDASSSPQAKNSAASSAPNEVVADASSSPQAETKMFYGFKRFEASIPQYKDIEEIIHLLENHGFVLQEIHTGGTTEDYHYPFRCVYYSFNSFVEDVHDSFRDFVHEIKEKDWCCFWDWSYTDFVLYSETSHLEIKLSVNEHDGDTSMDTGVIFWTKKSTTDNDNITIESIVEMLSPYFEKIF